MFEKIFNVVSFIGAVQGIFHAGVFLFKKGNHPATRSIAAFTFVFSVGLLEPYLTTVVHGWIRDPLLSVLGFSNFLYGPLLYLFVCFLTAREPRFRRRQLVHFLPFIFLQATAGICALVGSDILNGDFIQLLGFEALMFQMLAYNVSAILLLSKHRQMILKEYSHLGEGDLHWLRGLLIFVSGVYVLSFAISHLLLFGWELASNLYLVVQLAITGSIFMMTYRLILQPQIFSPGRAGLLPGDPEGVTKYAKSGLKPEQADEYLHLLFDCMRKEKPYLDPDLTIHGLSGRLGISKNHLTQVINEQLAKNFYAYINEYRIGEAKQKMSDPALSHLNLTGIALESGFKSKSAFNMNFKKITGYTPTEWKKRSHVRATTPTADQILPKTFNPGGLNALTPDEP